MNKNKYQSNYMYMQNYINKEKSNIIKHAHKKKYEIHKNYFDYNFSLNYITLFYFSRFASPVLTRLYI